MNNPQITPELDHNVYILGAGFSVDAGLPLIENFLEQMAESLEGLRGGQRQREIDAIQKVFEFRLRAAGAAYRAELNVENIEELFSLASAIGHEDLSDDITTAIGATLDFAHKKTSPATCNLARIEDNSKQENRSSLPLYQLYAEVLNGNFSHGLNRNSVITFNYDTLLEDGLTDAGIPFSYGLGEADVRYHETAKSQRSADAANISVYKLHGSVNWSVDPESPTVNVHGNYEDLPPADRMLLVPPTWRKTFGLHLASLWENAVNALSQATRIVILGFSMRPTDAHFKYLLIAGLRENISLRKLLFVNPRLDATKYPDEATNLRRNLFSILRPELESRGIIELLPMNTMQLLLSSNGRKRIQRNPAAGKLQINVIVTPRSGFAFE